MQGLLSCLWRPLPAGWVEYHDKCSGRPYYVNASTGSKSWVRPVHETAEEQQQDKAVAAANVAEGAEKAFLSEASVQQPKSVRPVDKASA